MQDRLWQHAWKSEIKPAPTKPTEMTGEVVGREKFYLKTKKPRAKVVHDWRTRPDPFERVKDYLEITLQLEPNITATALLEKLITQYPGDFCKGHLRSLQRRVKEIREIQNKREEHYQRLMISQKNMTTESANVSL